MKVRLRRRHRFPLFRLIALLSILPLSILRAAIPWPEVSRKLAVENAKLAQRPGGRNGEYLVVCTLYFTPKESGFTAARGFDATLVTRAGLERRKYPRDFLRAVKKEGYGRLTNAVNGHQYIHYNGHDSYSYSSAPSVAGQLLIPGQSAAARASGSIRRGVTIETHNDIVQEVFGSTRWKIVDTGGGLRPWQIDCYFGEDEPLGPQNLGRPRSTTFEYAYAEARVTAN